MEYRARKFVRMVMLFVVITMLIGWLWDALGFSPVMINIEEGGALFCERCYYSVL